MRIALALLFGLLTPIFLGVDAELSASEEDDAHWQNRSRNILRDAQIFFDNINTTLERLENLVNGQDNRLKTLESNPILKPKTPAQRLHFSQILITKGSSYRPNEILEVMPRSSSANVYLAIEIKNILTVPLENYRSDLTKGQEMRAAPINISPFTSEVFSVSSARYFPEGTFSYDISMTDESLHVYVLSKTSSQKLAVGFLDKTQPISQIDWANSASRMSAPSDPSAFRATAADGTAEKKAIILEIRKGNLYARATYRLINNDKHVLSIELYSFTV